MSNFKLIELTVGMVMTNCYIGYNDDTREAFIVDPGDDARRISRAVREQKLNVKGILLTHGHFDHIWGTGELREAAGVKLYALDAEKTVCEDAHNNVSEMTGRPCTVEADEYLRDGQELTLADSRFRVIATPGHTIGSCCYYFPEAGFLVSGDTLFAESVGRTDFPTGSMSSLVRSIKEKLYVLPGETRVYPGHGDSTTIEHEMQYNPFTA